jgi:hypothetical protein
LYECDSVEPSPRCNDEADKFRGLAEKAKALGTWGGAGASVVSGAFDVYEDVNNPKYTAEEQRTAVAIDVVKTAASVGAGLFIAGTTLPIIIASRGRFC